MVWQYLWIISYIYGVTIPVNYFLHLWCDNTCELFPTFMVWRYLWTISFIYGVTIPVTFQVEKETKYTNVDIIDLPFNYF